MRIIFEVGQKNISINFDPSRVILSVDTLVYLSKVKF